MNEFAALESAYPKMVRADVGLPSRGQVVPQQNRGTETKPVQPGMEAQDPIRKDIVDVSVEDVLGAEKRESEPELYGLVKEMNQAMTSFTSLRFNVDQESKTYVVSIVDEETDEVVRQIPSDNMADLAERMRDLEGLLFDVKA